MAIARKGLRRIVVDGVEYHWRGTGDTYIATAPSLTIIQGAPPRMIRAVFPFELPRDQPGWWNQLGVTTVQPRLVERTIRVARRHAGNTTLTVAEVLEVLDLDRPRTEDRLRDLTAALGARPFGPLIRRILAVGCHGDRGELVDDWVACHSEELALARRTLEQTSTSSGEWYRQPAIVRSALAFITEACARVGLDYPLDTSTLDAELLTSPRVRAPWGVPVHHDWWQH